MLGVDTELVRVLAIVAAEALLVENHARHHEACEEAGHQQPSVVPLMRTVFASRDVGALARASAALQKQASAIARTRGINLRGVAGAEVDDWAIVGEPERVADGIARYQQAFGMTHLIVRSQIPGVERAEILSSLELVAELQA